MEKKLLASENEYFLTGSQDLSGGLLLHAKLPNCMNLNCVSDGLTGSRTQNTGGGSVFFEMNTGRKNLVVSPNQHRRYWGKKKKKSKDTQTRIQHFSKL